MVASGYGLGHKTRIDLSSSRRQWPASNPLYLSILICSRTWVLLFPFRALVLFCLCLRVIDSLLSILPLCRAGVLYVYVCVARSALHVCSWLSIPARRCQGRGICYRMFRFPLFVLPADLGFRTMISPTTVKTTFIVLVVLGCVLRRV